MHSHRRLRRHRAAVLADYRVSRRIVGGGPCAVIFDGTAPLAVVLDIAIDGTVTGIYSVTNPTKLTTAPA
ncbi:hypothetical protein FEK33_02245 [Nocardia asteroides NBRC 15531]|uniref:Uncharacterized protein n=1 Tax=Nocardia asteroides NBRC 15531 TaxID=1110697 RepID=U5E9P7_NOCAS|nr:hypothetical protein [Nocardia asteroides]TLF69165.1 hypothetical protein FEK33_02245 [Nocardia asteroides NBRC 15531]UGT48647.1 hypothetical protein LT345_30085 [Nocardia asteroides]SFL66644.1 RNA polymerase sigma-70 factor, ECF subfamily [Nocardia asteroides]VEG31789.1 Uncharacterised protein [Nocardia asteroides]GAD83131.1 hypothetical protein NCAST_17_01130 [Nocardia asteroides NBRC 15531]